MIFRSRESDVEELNSLVERVRGGEPEAYGDLVRRFQDMAVGYAYSLLGDFHLAEDAAQESFLLAHLELRRLRDPSAFPGWLRRIIHSQCGRQRRRQDGRTVDLETAASVASGGPDPAQALEANESEGRLLRALDSLPERDRAMVTLHYISRLNHREIAAFLGVSAGTVNNRLYSSRKRLREELTRMTADELQTNRPSRDEEFVARIEGRVGALVHMHAALAYGLAYGLAEAMSEAMGDGVEVEVEMQEATRTTSGEYLKALPGPSLTVHFLVEPTGGRAILDLGAQLAYAVAEKTLATGGADWNDVVGRMGEDEWARLGTFGVAIKRSLEQTWKPVVAVEFVDGMWESNIVGLMTDPDFGRDQYGDKLAELREAPDDPAVRLDMRATMRDVSCRLSLCYPPTALEGVLPHLA